MDLEKAFTFIWKDDQWPKKVGIAAALMLTIIGSIGVIGWISELARRVAQDEKEPIPDWDNIGDYFLTGFKFFGITFIWSLPIIIVTVGTALLVTPAVFMEESGPFPALIPVFITCLSFIMFIYIILINLLTPPLWVLLAEQEPFVKLINPTHAWELFKANGGGFHIAMLFGWLIIAIVGSLGVIICLVGIFFTNVISQMIVAYLIGQAAGQARANLENTPAVPVA